jgi:predicted outer membrane protein
MKQATLCLTLVAFVLIIAFFHTLACAQSSGGGVLGPPTSYPTERRGGGSGREYSPDASVINRLSAVNVVEIKMSQDVAQRSHDATVQQLAQRMATRYASVGQQLIQVSRRVHLEDATEISLDDDTGTPLRTLQQLSGSDLDARYLALLAQNHSQLLSTLREMESQAVNSRLRDFARHQIPGAEADVEAIQHTNRTASNPSPSSAPQGAP